MNWLEHYKAVKHRIGVEAPMRAGKVVITKPVVKIPYIGPELLPEPEETPDTQLLSGLRPYRLAPLLLPILKAHDLRFLDVRSPSRKKMYHLARFEMYYVLQKDGLSLSQIGAIFNRDHSTILHGIQRWKEMIGE